MNRTELLDQLEHIESTTPLYQRPKYDLGFDVEYLFSQDGLDVYRAISRAFAGIAGIWVHDGLGLFTSPKNCLKNYKDVYEKHVLEWMYGNKNRVV